MIYKNNNFISIKVHRRLQYECDILISFDKKKKSILLYIVIKLIFFSLMWKTIQ